MDAKWVSLFRLCDECTAAEMLQRVTISCVSVHTHVHKGGVVHRFIGADFASCVVEGTREGGHVQISQLSHLPPGYRQGSCEFVVVDVPATYPVMLQAAPGNDRLERDYCPLDGFLMTPRWHLFESSCWWHCTL
jgi:hypothetical protein